MRRARATGRRRGGVPRVPGVVPVSYASRWLDQDTSNSSEGATMPSITRVHGRSARRGAAIVSLIALAAMPLSRPVPASTPAPEAAGGREAARAGSRTVSQRSRRAPPARVIRGVSGAAIATAPRPIAAAPGRAGMVIEIDPLPGEIGVASTDPIPAIPAALDPALDRSTRGLEVLTLPDGSQRVDLRGRFRSYSVATIGADGRLSTACADHPATALGLARAASTSNPTASTPRVPVGPREE